mmetsp:Transcript_22968/g.36553  ORF Transcript_22968/g.36553 Transcript_22968/m.36553 type:complete len:86 (+) Transcript_22968:1701-1958(+)
MSRAHAEAGVFQAAGRGAQDVDDVLIQPATLTTKMRLLVFSRMDIRRRPSSLIAMTQSGIALFFVQPSHRGWVESTSSMHFSQMQ